VQKKRFGSTVSPERTATDVTAGPIATDVTAAVSDTDESVAVSRPPPAVTETTVLQVVYCVHPALCSVLSATCIAVCVIAVCEVCI